MSLLNSLTILCVEDDTFALEEMASFLKKRASKVFQATDGAEGIRQFEIHRPDIVIADLLMPGMDGMEMLRQLKSKNPKLHSVIVTSVDTLETVLESIDLGVDNYIIKPVEFDELELKLDKIANTIISERKLEKGLFDDIQDKRTLEDVIKKEFIKSLKSYMGKGPREITVQLIGEEIKITVLGTLTVMEENLMKDMKNHQIVRQTRQIAYETITKKFLAFLEEILQTSMVCDKITIDLKKKIDQVTFTTRN